MDLFTGDVGTKETILKKVLELFRNESYNGNTDGTGVALSTGGK